jgi:hypothetical protein
VSKNPLLFKNLPLWVVPNPHHDSKPTKMKKFKPTKFLDQSLA